jgi:hypothetical protein
VLRPEVSAEVKVGDERSPRKLSEA